jgi:predicted transcriptional regulator
LAGTGFEADDSRKCLTGTGPQQTSILRVLTPENRRLLSLIHNHRPDSVSALCHLAGKAQSNVSRALASLVEARVVKMVGGRPKRPELTAHFLVIDLTDAPLEEGSG